MKKTTLIILIIIASCSSAKHVMYEVYARDHAKRKVTVMETVDVNDACSVYLKVTGRELDTLLINPFYEIRSNEYYFYVERKMVRR